MTTVPETRIRSVNDCDIRKNGKLVLYWMIANRRRGWNYSLQRAVNYAQNLGKPLVILEGLRCDYRWAADRFHRFVMQGMAANEAAFSDAPVTYYPYVEPKKKAGAGLVHTLAKQAAIVVTDDFPCYFHPRMLNATGRKLDVRLEAVDSNGWLPMRTAPKVFSRAFDFRRYLQKQLTPYLSEAPQADPLRGVKLPDWEPTKSMLRRWPMAVFPDCLDADYLHSLPIDHSVMPVDQVGGSAAAGKLLKNFARKSLPDYDELRNQPQEQVTSGLSPYLHFGHVSSHEVVTQLWKREKWSIEKLDPKPNGKAHGWWGLDENTESYLDQIITWRELGFNMCWQRPDYARYDSLPDWARKTLAEHASDHRPHCYALEEFEAAETHDPLWNAAQRQLVREGIIHNYLRMLWGKKILEWSASPREALQVMIELNNKYALDGRDPNSYSGIFWILGRYDRAWGPERKIFGKIRYMSSDNTARKVKVKQYIERFGA